MCDIPTFVNESRHTKHLNLLAKIAASVIPVGHARIAAAIVYKNNIISIGTCKKKTHPFQAKYGKNKDCIYLHAEIESIKNALRIISLDELSKSTLYIARVKYEKATKTTLLHGLAKPCEGCARAIANFEISKVFYTLDNEGFSYL